MPRDPMTPPDGAMLHYVAPPSTVEPDLNIVAWLDLLGFRNRLRQTRGNPAAELDLIREYHQVVTPALESFGYEYDEPFRWRTLTDSVIVAGPLLSFHPESTVAYMVLPAASAQFKLTRRGWFLRGGITVGDLYMDDQIVIGNAMLDAYEMEGKADVPRVLVDDTIIELTKIALTYYADPYDSAPNDLFVVDTDGRVFVNYLHAPFGMDYDHDDIVAMLKEHRERVEENLQETANNRKLNRKYRWTAAYHNWFCRRYLPRRDHAGLIIVGIRPRPFRKIVASPAENVLYPFRGDPFEGLL